MFARRDSHRGLSLVEALVVLAVVAVGAAVAVASLAQVARTATLRESFVDVAAAARRKATGAVAGPAARFDLERDAALPAGVTVNPKYVPTPPGTEAARVVELEGGTGNARLGGRRAVASVVFAEEGHRGFAYAIVFGAAGRVELQTFTDGEWRRFE
jgi:prepilin-type N-terminal cleavage/methylation domain-containing protein